MQLELMNRERRLYSRSKFLIGDDRHVTEWELNEIVDNEEYAATVYADFLTEDIHTKLHEKLNAIMP